MEFVKAMFLPAWWGCSGALSAAKIQAGTGGGRLLLGFWAIVIACVGAILATSFLQDGTDGLVAVTIGLAVPPFGVPLLERLLLTLRPTRLAQQTATPGDYVPLDLFADAAYRGITDFQGCDLSGCGGFDCGGLDLF